MTKYKKKKKYETAKEKKVIEKMFVNVMILNLKKYQNELNYTYNISCFNIQSTGKH